MKLKNIKKGKRFKQYTEGLVYLKRNNGDIDVLNKKGRRICGANFSPDTEVISL